MKFIMDLRELDSIRNVEGDQSSTIMVNNRLPVPNKFQVDSLTYNTELID